MMLGAIIDRGSDPHVGDYSSGVVDLQLLRVSRRSRKPLCLDSTDLFPLLNIDLKYSLFGTTYI